MRKEEIQKAVSIYVAAYHTGCEVLDYVLREMALLEEEYQVQPGCMAEGGANDLHPVFQVEVRTIQANNE